LEYGNTFGFSADSTNRYDYSILLTLGFWTELIFRTIVRHFAIFCFPLFISGLLIARKNTREYVFDVWLIAVALTWTLVPVTSIVHEYYQLPFMLPAVVFVGKTCSRYFGKRKKTIIACLCLGLITGSLIYSIDYMPLERSSKSGVFKLAQQVNSIVPKNALIISSTGGDPTLLYLSNHQGWLIDPRNITQEFITSKQKLGAEYLVGSFTFVESYNKTVDDNQKQKVNSMLSKYPNLVRNGEYFIAKLDK
jgi:hypothetical protein